MSDSSATVSPAGENAPRHWVRVFERVRASRSVVLGYHGVELSRRRDDLQMLQVSPRRFSLQIDLLRAAGFRFVTFAELVRISDGNVPPPGLAAITFDDGMRNNHDVALPILQERGIPATVYVTVDFLGGSSPWIGPAGDGAMMDAEHVRALAAAGWEIGGHTMSHADLSTLDRDACRAEIADGCAALEQVTGSPVETFAYPFGRYGPAALQAVRDCGLSAAVTTGSGSWDRYEMTRGMIGAIDPLSVVLLKLTDRYEPLLRSRPMRALRHASKGARKRLGGS
jgi:peptidoglycan/xylan/chitin deacetylase (PgdA/CDA1 family)